MPFQFENPHEQGAKGNLAEATAARAEGFCGNIPKTKAAAVPRKKERLVLGSQRVLAAREAREVFEKSLAKLLEKDGTLEEDTKLIADKIWQASQSNRATKKNLTKNLEDLVAAFEDNDWDKNRESSFLILGKW